MGGGFSILCRCNFETTRNFLRTRVKALERLLEPLRVLLLLGVGLGAPLPVCAVRRVEQNRHRLPMEGRTKTGSQWMRGRRYIVRDSKEEGKVVPSELQRERRAGLDPVDEALAARQVDLEVLGPLLAVSAGSARMKRRRIGNFLKVIVEF